MIGGPTSIVLALSSVHLASLTSSCMLVYALP